MATSIDPRLIELIGRADDDDELEVALKLDEDLPDVADDRGPGGPLIDRVAQHVGEHPSEIRHLPKLGVLYLRGSRRLIQRLLEQKEVRSASST